MKTSFGEEGVSYIRLGREGRGCPPTLIPFPILHELCESLERVVLLPVHVRLDFSIEANGIVVPNFWTGFECV